MVSVAVCCSSELPKYRLWETVSFSTLSSLKGATLKNAVMAVMDVLKGLRGEQALPGLLSHNGKLGLCSLCERLQLKAMAAVMALKYVFVYRGAVPELPDQMTWESTRLDLFISSGFSKSAHKFPTWKLMKPVLKSTDDAKHRIIFPPIPNLIYNKTFRHEFLQVWFFMFLLDSRPEKYIVLTL